MLVFLLVRASAVHIVVDTLHLLAAPARTSCLNGMLEELFTPLDLPSHSGQPLYLIIKLGEAWRLPQVTAAWQAAGLLEAGAGGELQPMAPFSCPLIFKVKSVAGLHASLPSRSLPPICVALLSGSCASPGLPLLS